MEDGVRGLRGLSAGIPVWWRCEQENVIIHSLRLGVSTAPAQKSNSIRAHQ